MEIFKDKEVYGYSFDYEEVKIAIVVSEVATKNNIYLDYEEVCIIAKNIFYYWDDSTIDDDFALLIEMFPWVKVNHEAEETYYSQAYAERTALNYIKLYQLMTNN